MFVFLLILGFLILYWSIEAIRLRRALGAIPVRIHVNGSRGKSSVTRLIAAALRESGIRTVAKTTGSSARLILPDGTEKPVIRLGTPNICEQIGILDQARKLEAEVVVMECMALRPDLQRFSEEKIIHSTIGVITNVRADHLDVMGPTIADVALALSSTLPRGGRAYVGANSHMDRFGDVARKKQTVLQEVTASSVPPDSMEGFAYIEHEENVALTLAVTRQLGVDDETAIRGMHKVTPDVGACRRWHVTRGSGKIEFLNIFAANDLESTITIWNRLGLASSETGPTVALLNLRSDRIDRSLQFAQALEGGLRADYYMLVGDFSARVLRTFERAVSKDRLLVLGRRSPREIFDRVSELGTSPRVGGVGNIGGLGHDIIQYVSGAGGDGC